MDDYKFYIVELIRLYYSNEISEDQREELTKWINLKYENRHLFDSLLKEEGQVKENFNKINIEKAIKSFDQRIGFRKIKIWNYWMGYAAAILIPIILFTIFRKDVIEEKALENPFLCPGKYLATLTTDDGKSFLLSSEHNPEIHGVSIIKEEGKLIYTDSINEYKSVNNMLETPIGGEYSLILSDGTSVYVNARSRFEYPTQFNENERKVFLEGEAFFDVNPNDKPFIIETGMGNIKVLGTSFGITYYPEEEMFSSTLVSGKILYSDSILLHPNERIVVFSSGRIEKETVNVNEYIGWTDGKIIFSERTLDEIMRMLARWYDIEVSYRTPELKNIRFDAHLQRYDNINQFLKLLKKTDEINYKIEGKNIEFY